MEKDNPECFTKCKHNECSGKKKNAEYCQFCMRFCLVCDDIRFRKFLREIMGK